MNRQGISCQIALKRFDDKQPRGPDNSGEAIKRRDSLVARLAKSGVSVTRGRAKAAEKRGVGWHTSRSRKAQQSPGDHPKCEATRVHNMGGLGIMQTCNPSHGVDFMPTVTEILMFL